MTTRSLPAALRADVVEVLKAAREKIAKPEAWIKGDYARASDGRAVIYSDTAAVCWCSEGAVFASGERREHSTGHSAIRLLETAANTWDVADFNDDPATTHADVLAVFDKAIALAEQEQA